MEQCMSDRDWRLQTTTEVAEDWKNPWSGQIVPKGTRITVVTVAKLNSKKLITMPVPNGSAILLSASRKSYLRAKELRKKNNIDSSIKKNAEFVTESEAFDFIEDTIQSIILAFSAIEAFANEVIPEDYQYACFLKNKTTLETVDKKGIESKISLEEKLDVVIPKVLGVQSLKRDKAWSKFMELKKLRNRIIHMKTEDRKSSGPDSDTLWHELLKSGNPPKTAFEAIKYFTSKMDAPPQWVDYAISEGVV